MGLALEEAQKALSLDEVPVGAVVVQYAEPQSGEILKTPRVLSKAHNLRESNHNPVGHSEILAIEGAAKALGRWRLSGCALFVTLEPCLMCAGAIVLSRLDDVIYGAPDPKTGAVQSLYTVLSDERLNHQPKITQGVLQDECSQILKDFFKSKRS